MLTCEDETLAKAVALGLAEPGVAQRARVLCRLAAGRTVSERPGYQTYSGEALAVALGVSRAAVHKHVAALQAAGVQIDAIPGRGYNLASPPLDVLSSEVVVPLIADAVVARREEGRLAVGLPYRFEHQCESTNGVLKRAAFVSSRANGPQRAGPDSCPEPRPRPELQGSGEPEGRGRMDRCAALPSDARWNVPDNGSVCACGSQTGGRGRLGRAWTSEPGKDLTFSVLLRPRLMPQQSHLLSLAAAVAVGETLEREAGCDGRVTIKWPNNVLLAGGKVCGILLEGSIELDSLDWAVAGIGLNVNSRPATTAWAAALPRGGAPLPVSLLEHLGRPVPRAPLLAAILVRLAGRWEEVERGEAGSMLEWIRSRDALAGQTVRVTSAAGTEVIRGIAVGIGPDGELRVEEPGGSVSPVVAGDVTLAMTPKSVNPDVRYG